MDLQQHVPEFKIPPHCIWMDAGVVGYKLCDRNLQCDHCPFDIVMRQPFPQPVEKSSATAPEPASDSSDGVPHSIAESLFAALMPIEFPADRLYQQGHVWVKEEGSSCLIGVDHFVARLLGSLVSIVLPHPQSRLVNGGPWCWLIHHDGAFSLRAPINGLVVETNPLLTHHPEVIIHEPYEGGWLVRATANNPTSQSMRTAAEQGEHVGKELTELRDNLTRWLSKHELVGRTMRDGGFPIDMISALIGSKGFAAIVSDVFAA